MTARLGFWNRLESRSLVGYVRVALVGLLMLLVLTTDQSMTLLTSLGIIPASEEDETGGTEKSESKIAIGDRPSDLLRQKRRSACRHSLAALRAQISHTHSAIPAASVTPLWEHALREGLGAPRRC